MVQEYGEGISIRRRIPEQGQHCPLGGLDPYDRLIVVTDVPVEPLPLGVYCRLGAFHLPAAVRAPDLGRFLPYFLPVDHVIRHEHEISGFLDFHVLTPPSQYKSLTTVPRWL